MKWSQVTVEALMEGSGVWSGGDAVGDQGVEGSHSPMSHLLTRALLYTVLQYCTVPTVVP